MDFQYSEEQQALRSTLRRFLDRECDRQLRGGQEVHSRRDLWGRLSLEFGLPGVHVPEDLGGLGLTAEETVICVEELGRVFAPVPAGASLMAIEAIRRLGSERQHREQLRALASGQSVGVLAVTSAADVEPGGAVIEATVRDREARLNGELRHVQFGAFADVLVIPARVRGSDDVRLFLVDPGHPGVQVEEQAPLDLSRPIATICLEDVPAEELSGGEGTIAAVLDMMRLISAADLLGSAQAALDATVAYASQRVQFDRPIGAFQAVKHMCADMAVELDIARANVMYAALVASELSEFEVAAPLAKAAATDTALFCAESALQVHGGIGFTWDIDIHRHFRRAKSGALMMGGADENRALAADRAGLVF